MGFNSTLLIVFSTFIIFHCSRFSTAETDANTLVPLLESFNRGVENPNYKLNSDALTRLGSEIHDKLNQIELGTYVEESTVFGFASKLFDDGRIQEGIWLLDSFGFYAEAEFLSKKLEELLESKPLVANNYITAYGASEPRWGKAGSFPVVIKTEDHTWAGAMLAEEWVYKLDRILGLNLVPLTFIGKINGYDFSAQVAIMNAHDSEIEFRMSGYNNHFPELFILDFLIQNRDRHGQNSIFTPMGDLVAIDNGHSAAIKQHQDNGMLWRKIYPHYTFDRLPRANIVRTIRDLDLEEFRQEFLKFASPEIVDVITENLRILKSDFQEVESEGLYRPIRSELRLIPNMSIEQQYIRLSCSQLFI